MDKNFNKRKVIAFLICFVVSFFLLFTHSSCSPLNVFNERVDYQWFLTLGNGILNGKIPYKDLFEQKGPVVFFVYALFSLTQNAQIATFIFEIISFTFFLYFLYKIVRRSAGDLFSSLSIIILATFGISTVIFYDYGGAVEEYLLPVIAWLILIFLEYFVDGKPLGKLRSFLIGLFASLIFWSKYLSIIIPGVYLIIWLIFEIKNKKFKDMGIDILFMFLGFVIVTIPVVIYFFANDALYDLLYCYFYLNITAYNNNSDNGLKRFFVNLFLKFNFLNFVIIIFYALSVALLIYYFIKNKKEFFVFLPAIVNLVILLFFISNVYVYYLLVFFPYFVFDIIALNYFVKKFKMRRMFSYFVKFSSIVVLLIYAFATCFKQTSILIYSEYSEITIANTIQDYGENQDSVYCYKIMDYGFYNLLGITPNEKFFAKNNLSRDSFPEMYDYMENVIVNQKYFFVITDLSVLEKEEDFLLEYYDYYMEDGYFVLLTVRSN